MQAEAVADAGPQALLNDSDVRVALAVAIVQRRKEKGNAAAAWKKKALVARSSLLSVSKSLRRIASSNLPEQTGTARKNLKDEASRILHELAAENEWANGEPGSPEFKQFVSQTNDGSSQVTRRSLQLRKLIEAVAAINALNDLLEGRLFRIWEQRPLQQALLATSSLLALPDSKFRTVGSACAILRPNACCSGWTYTECSRDHDVSPANISMNHNMSTARLRTGTNMQDHLNMLSNATRRIVSELQGVIRLPPRLPSPLSGATVCLRLLLVVTQITSAASCPLPLPSRSDQHAMHTGLKVQSIEQFCSELLNLGLPSLGEAVGQAKSPAIDRAALKEVAAKVAQEPTLGSCMFYTCMSAIMDHFMVAMHSMDMAVAMNAVLLLLAHTEVAVVRISCFNGCGNVPCCVHSAADAPGQGQCNDQAAPCQPTDRSSTLPAGHLMPHWRLARSAA
jgi:hypothetical protein